MYTHRLLEGRCKKALSEHKIVVIVGARQTGKSTLVRHLLDSVPPDGRLFLNLDDPFLRDRLVTTEGALVRAIEDQARRPWARLERFVLVLDEAQKAPGLFDTVKALYDSDPKRLGLVITGSSALQIHDPVAESFAGRARLVHLHPFTLSEGFAHVHGADPTDDLLPGRSSSLLGGTFDRDDFDWIAERCRFDGPERRRFVEAHFLHPLYPEPCGRPDPEEWITDYLATYVEKDVQSLAGVGNVGLFRACIRQVAARSGNPVKWETMAQEIGTSSVTFRKYVGLMEQTYSVMRLPPFTANPVKRVTRAPKAYVPDPGILWGLRGFEDSRLLEASGMLGTYFESLAVSEIAKWCSLEPTAPQLFFWSKTAVSEVDLVVANRGYHIPFEFKLSRRFTQNDLRGLDAFEADHRGLRIAIPYRVLLYLGDPVMPDPRTYVLPLWAFA